MCTVIITSIKQNRFRNIQKILITKNLLLIRKQQLIPIIRMEKHLLPKIPALRILVQAILAPVILVPAVMVPTVTVPETATGTMWIPAPAATLPGAATGIMWIPAPAVMFL